MKDSSFEDIIQSKLEGAKTQLPAGAWESVSAGISSSPISILTSSVIGKVFLGITVVTITTLSYITLTQKSSSKVITEQVPEQSSQEEVTATENSDDGTVKGATPDPIEDHTENRFSGDQKSSTQIEALTNSAEHEKIEVPEFEQIINSEEKNVNLTLENQNDTPTYEKLVPDQITLNDEEPQSETVSAPPNEIQLITLNEPEGVYKVQLNQELSAGQSVIWFVNDIKHNDSQSLLLNLDAGSHSVMARIYAENELTATLFKNIEIEEQAHLVVPNTFTPHSSLGYNDFFDIDHEKSENIAGYFIEVYSSEGLVFKSSSQKNSWDGYINGNPAKEGVYSYRVIYWAPNEKRKTESGTVLLQR